MWNGAQVSAFVSIVSECRLDVHTSKIAFMFVFNYATREKDWQIAQSYFLFHLRLFQLVPVKFFQLFPMSLVTDARFSCRSSLFFIIQLKFKGFLSLHFFASPPASLSVPFLSVFLREKYLSLRIVLFCSIHICCMVVEASKSLKFTIHIRLFVWVEQTVTSNDLFWKLPNYTAHTNTKRQQQQHL